MSPTTVSMCNVKVRFHQETDFFLYLQDFQIFDALLLAQESD